MRWFRLFLMTLVASLVGLAPADAHPAPFSYLDLHLDSRGLRGVLVIHDYDAAHVLSLPSPDTLRATASAVRYRAALIERLESGLAIRSGDAPARIEWGALEALPERQSLSLAFAIPGPGPARVRVDAFLFPYDPAHQTFVNVHEDGALAYQSILDAGRRHVDFYAGSPQGRASLVRTFVISGFEHILIGPDHVLFLVGLLLLGGALTRLALIVTAFTLGHSLTLSIAALGVWMPTPRLIEPLIALTIVVVGADNLLVLRATSGKAVADIRAGLALGFGLIHGFGFAVVLREFGLPGNALGWSLFAFNLGVEVGQLAIVIPVASLIAAMGRRSPAWGRRLAFGGSIAVILAGTFWFVERTLFSGGRS